MKKFFLEEHKELTTIFGLLIAFYFLFFHNIWTYPLMDVDETRYVDMARVMHETKNYLTLYLNSEYFFEKPPLYFWLVSGSFTLFNHVSEGLARLPISICATLSSLCLYFCGKKAVSRKFGIFSALILATSIEFIILTKVAMLDMVLTTFIILSLYSGFMTFFVQDKYKKYFWWLFYIFSGLAVMSKGIPGFIVPFGTMFFAGIITKKFKDFFRPQYLIIGSILFLLITLPWHIIMLKMHNPLFYNEYIIKHHLARFMGGEALGRSHGPCYYFITLLWGLIPWIPSFIAMLINYLPQITWAKVKNLKTFNFSELDNTQKYLTLNIIGAVFIMLFFTSSDTKLVTYILPIYACLAGILSWYWINYIEKNEHSKSIRTSVYIFNGILILAGVVAIFSNLFLPEQLVLDIKAVKWFTIILTTTVPLAGIIFARKNKRLAVFTTYVAFMLILSAFGTGEYFKVDYKFGQNDLMNYAKYAKENKLNIASFNGSRKYSLMYYSKSKVEFIQEPDFDWLQDKLNEPNTVIVIRSKEAQFIDEKIQFKIVKLGRKYNLITGTN